ncbi:MAG: protein kinase [Polyangiaceae bacterium]
MIQIGQVISGKYKLLRLLGDGGMGSVYEAQHEVLGTRVAIKVLHADLARRAGLIERFLQEARVAAQIESANVVRVSDVDRTPDGIAYLVMELLQGEPLSATLERDRKVPIATAVEYTRQILSALEAAHALGVTHRDLKPEKVFLTFAAGKPVVKIIDFGIAKLRTPSTTGRSLTVAGITMGTAEYMAPEQAFSADKADARSDVYAVGVMLYEMISGERPVAGDDARVIAMKVDRGEVKPLVHAAPDVPRELAGLVHRAMAARPEIRFQSASEMRLALEAVKVPALPNQAPRAATRPVAAASAMPVQAAASVVPAPHYQTSAESPQARVPPKVATVMAAPLAMDAFGPPPNTERPPYQPQQQHQQQQQPAQGTHVGGGGGGAYDPAAFASTQSPYANPYGAAAQTNSPQQNVPPPRRKRGGGGWLLLAIPLLLGVGVVVTVVVIQSQGASTDTPLPTGSPIGTTPATQATAQNTQNTVETSTLPTSTDTAIAPLLTGNGTAVRPPTTTTAHPTASGKPGDTNVLPPTLPFPSGFPTAFPSTLPFPLPSMNIPSGFPTAFPFPPPTSPQTAAPTATQAPAAPSSTNASGL